MNLTLHLIGLAIGLYGGFMLGVAALAHITKGENIKAVLDDKDKKMWLGLLAWGFAAVGGWLGWELASYVIYANR